MDLGGQQQSATRGRTSGPRSTTADS